MRWRYLYLTGDAAEWIVINQLLDRRMIAADWAEWFEGAVNAVLPPESTNKNHFPDSASDDSL